MTQDDCIVLTVSNSTMTKVADPGTEYERKLNTLDIFFYPKGQTSSPCVFYHHEDLNNNTSGEAQIKINALEDVIRAIFPTEITCDVFVIANLPDYLTPTDPTVFNVGSVHTTLDALQSYVLKLDDENDTEYVPMHDMVNKPFVMAGLGTALKDSKRNATGTINLRRVASKVTISVIIPDYIDLEVTTDGVTETLRMEPTFDDNPPLSSMNAAFHNGAYKGYLYKDVDDAVDNFFLKSSKKTFKYSHSLPAEEYTDPNTSELVSIPSRRVYKCEVPFYTYAREWKKGASDAAYMTFEMKWGARKDDNSISYAPYYYQILINGPGQCFEPNHWYDMSVNVGVLGSTVEIHPIYIDHLAFYVLDWSNQTSEVDHPEEDVHLSKYVYLNIDTPKVEINNQQIGLIQYNASDSIYWNIEEAYYINNSGPLAVEVDYTSNITEEDNIYLDEARKGILIYKHDIPDNIYSPIYVTLSVWLDLNRNKQLDPEEEDFVREVEIIQYPMMYVVRDESSLRSVYVNNIQNHSTDNNSLDSDNKIGDYSVGSGAGVRNHNNGDVSIDGRAINNHQFSYSMFIINVTSFDKGDVFTGPGLKNDGYLNVPQSATIETNLGSHGEYKYIIGDPRQRANAIRATSGPYYDVRDDWATDHRGRTLQYYYPTDGDGSTFQIVAPKFRIVSFNNASTGACDTHGAALRCASLQEDGIPAGRWRLPTVAEIKYIIKLQKDGAIQPIFTSSSSSYATAAYADAGHNRLITLTLNNDEQFVWNNRNSGISVRCVYDEWFWGSEREAVKNENPSKRHDRNETQYRQDYLGNQIYFDKYFFTWGDREIIW